MSLVSINKLPHDTKPIIVFGLAFGLSKEVKLFGQGE